MSSEAPAASSSSAAPAAGGVGKIGVILPDSKSSARWETADRPALSEAFKAAGVEFDIQNAQGDKAAMATIADQMINSGVTVLMIVNLDNESGAAIEKKAAEAGVKTIDYDRLTLGGVADYYVSFDNVKVGELQGQGLAGCLGAGDKNIVYLNGSPTDSNATSFSKGAHSVLDPMTNYKVLDEQAVPDWDNQQAATIFEQMFTAQGGKIDGVLAANDGLGNATISVLKKNGLNGKVFVTGQDATVEGLQNILVGDQCMTVYKAIKKVAAAASGLAIALATGKEGTTNGKVMDTVSNREVPSVLETPQIITKDNVKDVVDDGYVKAADLCIEAYKAACDAAGIK
ncbi:sugar ABC transporter substrate-binding protein [Nakamurella antarctica]|nr:substrate-binding domain-containing protein [Nakamurella antarctica]